MPLTPAAQDEAEDAAEWVEDEAESVLGLINDRPLTAVAVAAAVGFVVARFLL